MASRDFVCGLGLGITVGVATCVSAFVSLKVLSCSRITRSAPVPRGSRQRGRCVSTGLAGNFVQVSDLERMFFSGIDRKAGLSDAQLQQLKDFLEGAVGDNVDRLRDCGSLAEILHLLCDLSLIRPNRYRVIMTILQNARIDGLNVETLAFHVEGLEQAVGDIEEGLNPRGYERDLFELDVLILHAEADRDATIQFRSHLMSNSGVHELSVQLSDEFCPNMTIFKALGDVFSRARYVFVFMTPNIVGSNLERFSTEMALMDSLTDARKHHRVVPVWTTSQRLDVPEMRPFPGIKYWHYTECSRETQDMYLNGLNRMLLNGRQEFVRA